LLIERLSEDDFFQRGHSVIFAVIKDLFEKGEPTDVVSMANRLEELNQMERAGGRIYLNEIIDRVATTASLEYYIEIVKKNSVLRKLIDVGSAISEMGYNNGDDADDIIRRAEMLVMDLGDSPTKAKSFEHLGGLVDEHIGQLEKVQQSGGEVIGIPTGFPKLDRMTTGLRDGDLVILAGRPSVGKTAFSLSIARRAALENYPVGIFSLEMSKDQVIDRMLAGEAHVDLQAMRGGFMSMTNWRQLLDITDKIKSAPIYVDDTPGISIAQLRSKARRMVVNHGVTFIIVDYLQLMDGTENGRSREQEVSYIARMLKSIARELNIPVIGLSQLNRAIEKRTGDDKRPRLSDLRESGELEQSADVVMFVYRDDYYQNKDEEISVDSEIIVAKQRNGPIGKVHVVFHKRFADFYPQFYEGENND